ncbi:PAS domain-containing protein [Polymorphobacter sp.]|uniref:PAS domain-containing protein n=1 Tax=Polymorphobacter sp. TaxID=1909290 RepID=UPI003F6EB439
MTLGAADASAFLVGGGEAGALIRSRDWSYPLGPAGQWPQALKTLVSVMLGSNQPMFVVWGPQRILLYNDGYAEILATKHPEALGRDFLEVWAEIRADIAPIVAQAYAGDPVRMDDIELVMHRRGYPEETHFAFSYTPVRDEDGIVCGFFCPCVEITEQVLSERRRQADAARQRGLFEQAPGFITILNGPSHVFEFVNAAYKRLFGYRGYVGKSVREALPELADQPFFSILDQVYASGERFVADRTPIRLVGPDGTQTERFLDFIFEPVTDETGQVTGIFVEGHDVTQARRAEDALRESEARMRAVIDAAPIGLVFADPTGRITGANARVEEIIGRTIAFSTDIRDYRDVYVAYHADGRQVEADEYPLAHVVDAGKDRAELDVQARLPDGSLKWVRHIATSMRDQHGDLIGAVVASLDIDPEKRFAENLERAVDKAVADREEALAQVHQMQKMETIGQLTGGVAHDFNNLLTPIIGSLDMLVRRAVGNERERRLIDGALQSAERAKILVQRLLAFARRQPLQTMAIDVVRLVDNSVGLMESTLGPTINIRIDVAPNLPLAVGDVSQLEMALLNLAVNARDAMPQGGDLTISASLDQVGADHQFGLDQGRYVHLSVRDTGTGMDKATLQRAIEPFFSTKGVGQGTGLGLSMAHGLMAQLGGALTVESEPGQGTSVGLWLPVSAGAADGGESPVETTPIPSARGTVLLVDDEGLVRMFTADMLADLGYEVVEAASAEEALQLIREGLEPSVLVTDHLMPGMNGGQLARTLRSQKPTLPVLVVSGYAEEAGIDPDVARLTKPFRNAELAKSLSDLLVGAKA